MGAKCYEWLKNWASGEFTPCYEWLENWASGECTPNATSGSRCVHKWQRAWQLCDCIADHGQLASGGDDDGKPGEKKGYSKQNDCNSWFHAHAVIAAAGQREALPPAQTAMSVFYKMVSCT